MKQAYLYCDKRSLNDATNYYLSIIFDCVKHSGYICNTVHSCKDIENPDLIISITAKFFCLAKLRYPSCKTIFWAQGVAAEETKMNITNLKSLLRFLIRRITEPIAIKKSTVLFCVSERMTQYYFETYGIERGANTIIMPCYNLGISGTFNISRYKTPTFVYAGNSSIWQGVDLMLDVYSRVEKVISTAKLYIYTSDRSVFKEKLCQYQIRRFEIKYTSPQKLQEEFINYKYGFILRENHIVNNVATPTKMNSYLSSYLIPIFSDAVDAFKNNIDLGEFTLMAECPLNASEIANKIITFEHKNLDYSLFKSYVNNVFDKYYNTEKYINIINNVLSKYL